jgi:serine beta-lactamase-like protein LACTB
MKIRIRNFLIFGAIGLGLIPVFVVGLFTYMNATKTPLHPSLQNVPFVTAPAVAAGWEDTVMQARETAIASLVEQNLPGMSVAVGVNGELVWAEGFGWADLEERVKYTPDTRFRIGTASTAITSAAAGLLIEQNRLKLDENIRTYVPEFPAKQWPVTVRQLMSGTAGIRGDGGDEEDLRAHCERPAEGLRKFSDSDLRYEPGSEFRYSSYGWILMSAAIEAAAGDSFNAFVRRNIFEPLGMTDTRLDSPSASLSNQANFYFPRFKADPTYGPQEPMEADFSCFSGAAGFVSTSADLARFGMAVSGGKLLQPATVHMLQAPQKTSGGKDTGYGLGWDLETATLAGEAVVIAGHDGVLMGGNVSSLMIFRERGIVVAVISNTAFADTYAIGLKVAEAFAKKR